MIGTALSGLQAAQAGLSVTSNNISNVNTPGYARQKVELTTPTSQGRVAGVAFSEPIRVANAYLDSTVYRRGGDAGASRAVADYLDRLQASLGTPGSSDSLPGRLDTLSQSAIALAGVIDSPETAQAFIDNAADVVNGLQQARSDAVALRQDVQTEISNNIEQANNLIQQIYDLNANITRYSGRGQSSAGLEDTRNAAITELSELLSITTRTQPDGQIQIETTDGTVLVDRRPRQLYYQGSATGALETNFPPISVRYTDSADAPLTGSQITGGSVGGTIGGLLTLRDHTLPAYGDSLEEAFQSLGGALNAVTNRGTSVPAPQALGGRPTGLTGGDRLGFTGSVQVAAVDQNGLVQNTVTIDFDALGAGATIDDAVAAINAGLGGNVTASLGANGELNLSAASGLGVSIGQGTPPSDRAGAGFSEFFGLNDIVRSTSGPFTAPGFVGSDPHGLGAAETAQFALTDSRGKTLATYTLSGSTGTTFDDIVTALNGSDVADYGSFSLNAKGRIDFQPNPGTDTRLSISPDSTSRNGTGVGISSFTTFGAGGSTLTNGYIDQDIQTNSARLPLARLDTTALAGEKGISRGDNTGAQDLSSALNTPYDSGRSVRSIELRFADLVGSVGNEASRAANQAEAAETRRDDAVSRRDSFSGVNLDEELANMISLQNSYSASARIMSTASEMYDTLISMI